jgi:hypothetical protein
MNFTFSSLNERVYVNTYYEYELYRLFNDAEYVPSDVSMIEEWWRIGKIW